MRESIEINYYGDVVVISAEQQDNLRVLANHLLSLPAEYPDFAMSMFTNNERGSGSSYAHLAECGTAACAVGHGPLCGFEPLELETWAEYSTRLFIPSSWHEAWEWCFGAAWSVVDNTAHGAAYRILWLLDRKSIPDNAYEQRRERAPISYWPTPANAG